ncbi:MAG: DNA-directed polymerase subunit beta, partial [Actinomycetota bacterium]|nr:DNA-directed polymerase subunit beta [Actinomycetota bacterium]
MAPRPTAANRTSSRVTFAKIREPLEVPDLLQLQRQSFDWLLGNPAWQDRVADALDHGRDDVPTTSGLEEIFSEIGAIADNRDSMTLSFRDHRFDDPKYTEEQCREKDLTYSAPLFVTAEFMNKETGEIKSQTVFMGDFPLMTNRATFIINGTERVVVSQLVRSPGVYLERTLEKTSDRELVSAKIIPSRGAWLEFDVDKNDNVGVRIDRKRKQPATALLLAMGMSIEEIRERFGRYPSVMMTLDKEIETSKTKSGTITREDALVDIFRKLRPGEPQSAEAGENLLNNLYFNPQRYDLAKVGRYKFDKKLGLHVPLDQSVLTLEDIAAAIEYLVLLHEGQTEMGGEASP